MLNATNLTFGFILQIIFITSFNFISHTTAELIVSTFFVTGLEYLQFVFRINFLCIRLALIMFWHIISYLRISPQTEQQSYPKLLHHEAWYSRWKKEI